MAGRKVGFYSIRYHARLMCQYVLKFGPVIREVFPNSPALHAALAAAMGACEVLVQEIDLVKEQGV